MRRSPTGRLSPIEPNLQNIKTPEDVAKRLWERINDAKQTMIYKVCSSCHRTEIGGATWSDKLCPKHHVILEESRNAHGINVVCRACVFGWPVPADTRHVTCPDCEAKS